MSHPYTDLPSRAFWRPSVGERAPRDIGDLWRPKFAIGKDEPIATLGSCFAQHISRALVEAGYNWLDAEPAPPLFPDALKPAFQYGVFSARVGNIYSVALLRQWVRWAFGAAPPSAEIWRDGDRYYDPFRPNIEPDGFASEAEVVETRAQTLAGLREMFETCGVLVFTLGLTEAWVNAADGCVYPMCPGTVAGRFVPGLHQFRNYDYPAIHADLCDAIRLVRERNPRVKFLLTVSPVPLTATATDAHVLVATTYSKSTLRAVAGAAAAALPLVDYFPSYEMISGFPFKAMFYDENLRTVSSGGVAFVMRTFLDSIASAPEAAATPIPVVTAARPAAPPAAAVNAVDVVCEDMLLDARGR